MDNPENQKKPMNPVVKIIGLVIVLIVGWRIFVSTPDPQNKPEPKTTAPIVRTIPERIVLPNKMELLFKKDVRCDNAEVNQFVADFLNVLATKQYKKYRLMVTQQRDPVEKTRFIGAYERLSKIEVVSIKKIDNIKELTESDLELKMTPPVYRLTTHGVLRDNSEREVELIIFKESGSWVSSN